MPTPSARSSPSRSTPPQPPSFAVVTLDDPANFEVKHTFSSTFLGIPGPLAGLLFSADGNPLYVVGTSETSTSALYAVPVTRDPRRAR